MFCVLLVSYALMAADRYLFPILALDIRRDFGFSLANTGLLSTIFTLGLGLGGLPTAYLLARFSRKAVLLTGIAIFSAGTALTAIVSGFWGMLLCLAATGIGMSMLATSMFALAASYFSRHRAAAIGSVNFCFGIGVFVGPVLASVLLGVYQSWRAPMLVFGGLGYLMIAVILLTVRSWFSETPAESHVRSDGGGAATLLNRNTVILTALSAVGGLVLYGFTGMYATFLRGSLHYSPKAAATVTGLYGLGALVSIAGGALGDRFSPRLVLSTAFFCLSIVGYLCFHGSGALARQAILTFAYGAIGSGTMYVNLAGYHVKAVRGSLASRGSGMFVTSFYGSAAVSGYLMGAITSHAGWPMAEAIQISLLSLLAAALALALRPSEMSL